MNASGLWSRPPLPLAILLATQVLCGCDQSTGPRPVRAEQSTARLHQSLTLVPDQVRAGDSLAVTLTIRNRTAAPVDVVSRYTCVAFLVARRGEADVPIRGTDYACGAAFTAFRLAPRDSLVATHTLVALVAGADSVPQPGVYTLRTVMNVDELSDLAVRFTVVE